MKRTKTSDRQPCTCALRPAFTLTELMVAVAVLIVVIIATSKIFGTASQITALGEATSSVMTEASTIERQMREDISKLTNEGFLAIRCVAVQNNVNQLPPTGNPGNPLLNPNLPPTAIIRADQLVFFANGVNAMQTLRLGGNVGIFVRAQDLASRVYYGHAFQLVNGSPAVIAGTNGSGQPDRLHVHDPQPAIFNPTSAAASFINPTPWYRGNVLMNSNLFATFTGAGTTGGNSDMFAPNQMPAAGPGTIVGDQPEARRWLLARQATVLIDDDGLTTNWNLNHKTIWANDHVTARSIFLQGGSNALPWGWSREIRNGRLDAAASQLEDIRQWVLFNNTNHMPIPTNLRVWTGNPGQPDQRTVIQGAVYYPRAERRAPSSNRVDQALTNHVIGSACSSFAIDWTYDDGVGAVLDSAGNVVTSPNGTVLTGVQINPGIEHPWFGLTDPARGVIHYAAWPVNPNDGAPAATILPVNTYPNNIESSAVTPNGVTDYWAIFGYNSSQPVDPTTGNPWSVTPPYSVAYTPFPSAIRVTMTLHDPDGKLEGGREFQFTIRLPSRVHE